MFLANETLQSVEVICIPCIYRDIATENAIYLLFRMIRPITLHSCRVLYNHNQIFRHQTIELINTLPEDEWETPREEAYWNKPLTIQWTVTKAWQHTLEHTHDVLRLHLFWDAAAYLDAHPEEIL